MQLGVGREDILAQWAGFKEEADTDHNGMVSQASSQPASSFQMAAAAVGVV